MPATTAQNTIAVLERTHSTSLPTMIVKDALAHELRRTKWRPIRDQR